MIEGATIRLRPWHQSDLPFLTMLRNDVALQSQLLARARGSDEATVRKWLENRSTQPDSLLFIIAERQDDSPVGYLQIADISPINQRGELGICLTRTAQGKGLGQQAVSLAINHLRNNWGFRKLNLRVRADNTSAICCYEKLGFTQCGLLQKHIFIDGGWQDLVLMEVFLIEI